MLDLLKLWVYDEEIYPNFFSVVFDNFSTGDVYTFEISDRRDDSTYLFNFLTWLANDNHVLVGYNNLNFDYPIMHEFMKDPTIGYQGLYQKSQSIIDGFGGFNQMIWPNDRFIKQIDLFKIHHFDNKARATSLKILEFNMSSENIIDLPYKPGTVLDDYAKDVTLRYNKHDVGETKSFLKHSMKQIKFRVELTEKYGRDFMNHNDTKIGKDFFIMELEASGIKCFGKDPVTNRKIPLQTPRAMISLGGVVLPYVSFEHPAFNMVLDWLNKKVINKTKGVFEYVDVTPAMAKMMDQSVIQLKGVTSADRESLGLKRKSGYVYLSQCPQILDVMSQYPNIKMVSGLKDKSGLNCVIDGFQYDFGTGGIHGSVESQIVHADEDYILEDWDVASYYPNLGISNRLYPAHLGEEFCDIYEGVYLQRKQFPKKTHPTENGMLKLALNGVYGDSNNQYSPFYDPLYTMSITINGQLSLCMLADQLIKTPSLEMVQINTDGLTIKYPRIYKDHVHAVCKWWETLTKLELERAEYSRMFVRDVNNYIAEYDGSGDLKRIGAYEHKKVEDDGRLGWHQNRSMIVVAKAAEAALVRGEDIETFIKNHEDINDFMLRTKIPRSNVLNIEYAVETEELQGTTRYYVSKTGGYLKKVIPVADKYVEGGWKRRSGLTDEFFNQVSNEIRNISNPEGVDLDTAGMPWDARIHTGNKSRYYPTTTSIQGGWLCTECNDMSTFNRDNLNYDFYIAETKKLVEPLLNGRK